MLYSSSFFISSNYAALSEMAEYASSNNKPFGYNLSAVFLIACHTKEVNQIIEHSDFVFGNEDEGKAYGEINKIPFESLKDVAVAIAKSKKANLNRPRVLVITQGHAPCILAQYQEGVIDEVKEIEVPKIEDHLVIDVNGAGDSFVGAFMSAIAQGKDAETAVKAGIWLSTQVIQRSGCAFPETNTFTY